MDNEEKLSKFAYSCCVVIIGFFLSFSTIVRANSTASGEKVEEITKKTVIDFGADPTGLKDSSVAFTLAITNVAGRVYVPSGNYRLDEMVTLNNHLFIESGTKIFRNNKSTSIAPIFWLSESYATLEGSSQNVRIVSENSTPEGIIKIGHKDWKDVGRKIHFCEVSNLSLVGAGKGSSSKGIVLFSSQRLSDQETESFFHRIDNLNIRDVETGIHLSGLSNSNSISRLVFFRVGMNRKGQAILIDGAMKNRIYDFFHHYSLNSTSLRLKQSAGEHPTVPQYNYVFGSVAEQGGSKARCGDITVGSHNVVQINCNAKQGFKTNSDFNKTSNILLR